MNSNEFSHFRKKLNKTQLQLAQLLGTSIKAIHSYEQGWRIVPPPVERQIFFLLSLISKNPKNKKSCWVIKDCPPEIKKSCPAWEFRAGRLCWFINGTICQGEIQKSWAEKITICRDCDIFRPLVSEKTDF